MDIEKNFSKKNDYNWETPMFFMKDYIKNFLIYVSYYQILYSNF